jgi:hypothetical protein
VGSIAAREVVYDPRRLEGPPIDAPVDRIGAASPTGRVVLGRTARLGLTDEAHLALGQRSVWRSSARRRRAARCRLTRGPPNWTPRGLPAAHAVTRSRRAIERTNVVERGTNGIEFVLTTNLPTIHAHVIEQAEGQRKKRVGRRGHGSIISILAESDDPSAKPEPDPVAPHPGPPCPHCPSKLRAICEI